MAKYRVPGDGPLDAEILILGERPTHDDAEAGRAFSSSGGIEFFGGWRRVESPKHSGNWMDRYQTGRWERLVGVPREQIRCEYLVRTISYEPPADWEIRRDEPQLRDIIDRMPNLDLVIPLGSHALRWCLQQPTLTADLANGIAHRVTIRDRQMTVLPVTHPAAALKAPDQNQERLSADLRAVRAYLDGELPAVEHVADPPIRIVPIRKALKQIDSSTVLGFDTEYHPDTLVPEAIQICWDDEQTSIVYAHDRKGLRYIQQCFNQAKVVVAHYAITDVKQAERMGLTVPSTTLHDTMLQAYVLAEKQAAKDLAYRRLGLDLPEFSNLVQPVDDARCRTSLQRLHKALVRDLAGQQPIIIRRFSNKTGKELKPKLQSTPMAKELKKQVKSLETALRHEEPGMRSRWTGSKVLARLPIPPTASWQDIPDQTDRDTYACADPWIARTMFLQFAPAIRRAKLTKVYGVTRRILPMIARMEQNGMQVDVDGVERFAAKLELRYYREVAQLSELVGRTVNPKASDKVSELLFEELYVEATKRTKSGKHYTTDDKYLKARKSDDRTSDHAKAVIGVILKARKTWKIKGYCDTALKKVVRQGDIWVILPDIKYTRVATGRFAEWLLTLPKHSEDGKHFRTYFRARDGKVLISSDLSQIELRMAAHLSGDPRLIDEYRQGIDKHQATVDNVLKQPGNRDEAIRRIAKNLNFAVLMDTTEYGLCDQMHEQGMLDVTRDDCRVWIDNWYDYYHHVKEFANAQKAFARRHGYVVAPLSGRRRYVGGVHSTVPYIRESAERDVQAFAYSTDAQFVMQTWMGDIWDDVLAPRRGQAEPWIQVHDDQLIEADAGETAKQVRQEIEACLPQMLDVPTKTESKEGLAWGRL